MWISTPTSSQIEVILEARMDPWSQDVPRVVAPTNLSSIPTLAIGLESKEDVDLLKMSRGHSHNNLSYGANYTASRPHNGS